MYCVYIPGHSSNFSSFRQNVHVLLHVSWVRIHLHVKMSFLLLLSFIHQLHPYLYNSFKICVKHKWNTNTSATGKRRIHRRRSYSFKWQHAADTQSTQHLRFMFRWREKKQERMKHETNIFRLLCYSPVTIPFVVWCASACVWLLEMKNERMSEMKRWGRKKNVYDFLSLCTKYLAAKEKSIHLLQTLITLTAYSSQI